MLDQLYALYDPSQWPMYQYLQWSQYILRLLIGPCNFIFLSSSRKSPFMPNNCSSKMISKGSVSLYMHKKDVILY